MRFLLALISLLVLTNCTEPLPKYSFFVAGHVYGDPLKKGKNVGLHKPFKDKTDFINKQEGMKYGFLLGDVVWGSWHWPETQKDIAEFNIPIEVVRGNHEGSLKTYEKMFGKSYKSFVENSDLFIILDPNIDNWNISDKQLAFLKETLSTKGIKARNIFVFMHQVLWSSKEKYLKPRPNSKSGRAEKINFWSEVIPLFIATNKNTIFYAGDVGAFSKERKKRNYISEYSYFKEDNLTFIASGMGGGVRDNIVITDIASDGTVSYRLIHLNGDDMNSLGKLEDYTNPN